MLRSVVGGRSPHFHIAEEALRSIQEANLYNLIVWQTLADIQGASLRVARSRFLEYTPDVVRNQLSTLSRDALVAVASWPTLLMTEGRGAEVAHVVHLSSLSKADTDIVASVRKHSREGLLNAEIWKLRDQLDIEQFEFSRSHWAVKDRDLLSLLSDAGHKFEADFLSEFEPHPLPAPPRRDLIKARDVISQWSHTEIDDLLLEAGVDGLAADRDVGSRRDRANAILRYVLDHPGALTAERYLLSASLVGAAGLDEDASASSDQAPRTLAPVGGDIETPTESAGRAPDKVFIVHGRNDILRGEVSDFIYSLGLQGIILHDQPNMGRHLLTKFIDEAELVTFAVVLMTGDDVGGLDADSLSPRARQNVILELGYFLAHLGQPRVCALISPGLETPSDFDGIVYIEMDEAGEWMRLLRRELEAAELPVKPIARESSPKKS